MSPNEVVPWTYLGEVAVTEVQVGNRTLPASGLGSLPLMVYDEANSIAELKRRTRPLFGDAVCQALLLKYADAALYGAKP